MQERRREAIAEWRDSKSTNRTGDHSSANAMESAVQHRIIGEDEETAKNAAMDAKLSQKGPTAEEKVCGVP